MLLLSPQYAWNKLETDQFLTVSEDSSPAIAKHTKSLKNTELPSSSDPTRIKVGLSWPICKPLLCLPQERRNLFGQHIACINGYCTEAILFTRLFKISPCQRSVQSKVHNCRFASLCCLILWTLLHSSLLPLHLLGNWALENLVFKIWSQERMPTQALVSEQPPLLIKQYNSCWIHKSRRHGHLQLHCNCHQ